MSPIPDDAFALAGVEDDDEVVEYSASCGPGTLWDLGTVALEDWPPFLQDFMETAAPGDLMMFRIMPAAQATTSFAFAP